MQVTRQLLPCGVHSMKKMLWGVGCKSARFEGKLVGRGQIG
jgi:hypothetical protein